MIRRSLPNAGSLFECDPPLCRSTARRSVGGRGEHARQRRPRGVCRSRGRAARVVSSRGVAAAARGRRRERHQDPPTGDFWSGSGEKNRKGYVAGSREKRAPEKRGRGGGEGAYRAGGSRRVVFVRRGRCRAVGGCERATLVAAREQRIGLLTRNFPAARPVQVGSIKTRVDEI